MNRQNAYKSIVDIIHKANDNIQYPRIRLRDEFMLQMAGANSRYPKSINITDGKPFGENKWYGRITIGGNLQLSGKSVEPVAEQLQTELDLFQQDPAKYAKGYGDLHSNCMFCNRELSNPQSVSVGYGPTCAENYGLPWGDIEPELAKAQASLEFDLPTTHDMPIQADETLEDGTIIDHKLAPDYISAITQLPPSTFADSPEVMKKSIASLNAIALWRLSNQDYFELQERLATCDNSTETAYDLLVSALFEAL